MANPMTKRGARTEATILDAARELAGSTGVTMKRLAEAAGLPWYLAWYGVKRLKAKDEWPFDFPVAAPKCMPWLGPARPNRYRVPAPQGDISKCYRLQPDTWNIPKPDTSGAAEAARAELAMWRRSRRGASL